jgi:hypothetical protein
MKAQFFIHLLTILLSFSCFAQKVTTYRYGVTGGLNAAQIKMDALTDIRPLYNIGVAMEQRLPSSLAFSYQLLYTRQGGQAGNRMSTSDYSLDYISLPILCRFKVMQERFFLQIGGQIGYLLHNKETSFSILNPTPQSSGLTYVNHWDMGVVGGAGCRVGRRFVADARYFHGSRSIFTDYVAPDPATGQIMTFRVFPWYNRVWSLNLTYNLN